MSRSKCIKKMVMQTEFRTRRERSKRTDYSRKGKNRFDIRQADKVGT